MYQFDVIMIFFLIFTHFKGVELERKLSKAGSIPKIFLTISSFKEMSNNYDQVDQLLKKKS